MDGRPITTKKTRKAKLKRGRQHLLQAQNYKHEPFLSFVAGLYSCRWKRYQRKRVKPGECCCSVMGTLFILGLSITAFLIITTLWTNQWAIFCLSFQISAPFFHLGAILIMILLAWPVAKHFFRIENQVLQMFILGPYLCVFLFLLFIPLGMYSPCIMEKGTLGPKPALIGHRGAPMVAPENTEMSFRKSIEYGAVALETDVTISFDGVPFLMHDRTLKRTTNVDVLSPEAADIDASLLPWTRLEMLNSGEWFFEKRPFFNMPPLSYQDEDLARKQTIYKFSDFLKLADQENKYVIFDLYRPPKYHPYRDKWINRTLEVILNESKIRPNLVLWLLDINRSYVQSVAPGFKQISSTAYSVEELQKRNIVKLNIDYREMGSVNIR